MAVDYKRVLLGMLGEKIVAKHFRDSGHQVEESLNVFDSDKDMIIDGNNVEVKTNAPLIYYDSFSFANGQYNKIMNSHRVYWVSVPLQTQEDQFAGCIFEMDPRVAKLHTIKFNLNSLFVFYIFQILCLEIESHFRVRVKYTLALVLTHFFLFY